jgi:hypothetical protein
VGSGFSHGHRSLSAGVKKPAGAGFLSSQIAKI